MTLCKRCGRVTEGDEIHLFRGGEDRRKAVEETFKTKVTLCENPPPESFWRDVRAEDWEEYMKNMENELPVELKERIDATMKGVAQIFVNDIVNGRKTVNETLTDIENSGIPIEGKKLIVFCIGLNLPIKNDEEEER